MLRSLPALLCALSLANCVANADPLSSEQPDEPTSPGPTPSTLTGRSVGLASSTFAPSLPSKETCRVDPTCSTHGASCGFEWGSPTGACLEPMRCCRYQVMTTCIGPSSCSCHLTADCWPSAQGRAYACDGGRCIYGQVE